MTPSRRTLFAVAAVVASLVLVSCTGSSPKGADGKKAKEAGKGGGDGSGGGKGTGGGGGGAKGTGGGTGGKKSNAKTSKPKPLDPKLGARAPARGTYTYAQKGTSARGATYPSEGTLEVRAPEAVHGGVEQKQTRKRLSAGAGESATFVFRTDYVELVRFVNASYACTLTPPLKVLKLPLTVGDAWTSQSTCEVGGVKVTIDFSGSVQRKEDRAVGSENVETFVLATTTTYKAGTLGNQTDRATTWLSPKYKLVIRSEQTTTSSVGNGRLTEQLVSVKPKG